jgi:hypothetical protein
MKRIAALIALVVFMLLAGMVFGDSQLFAKKKGSIQSHGGSQTINWYHGSANNGKITVTMGSENKISNQDPERDAVLNEETQLKHFGADDSLYAEDIHESHSRTERKEKKHYPPDNRRYESEDGNAHIHHDSSDIDHSRRAHEEKDGRRHGSEDDNKQMENGHPAVDKPEPRDNEPCGNN